MKYPFFLFFIIIILSAYWRQRERASGRRGVRNITIFGFAFCVMSFSLWAVARMDDIIASLPGTHSFDFFATPWPWISALAIGVALLLISFFTRKGRRNAA